MVNPALVAEVARLNTDELLELRNAIEARLATEVPEGQWKLLEQRVSEADARPNDYISLARWKAQRAV